MPSFGAPNCTNSIVFIVYKQIARKKAWLANIKRQVLPKQLYICSDCFKTDCFEQDLRVRK